MVTVMSFRRVNNTSAYNHPLVFGTYHIQVSSVLSLHMPLMTIKNVS